MAVKASSKRGAGFLAAALLGSFHWSACRPSAEASSLELRALDDSIHRPIPTLGEELTVLVFTASDCPVANGYAPEIGAIAKQYADQGVRFFVVNVEAATSVDKLLEHSRSYGLPGPVLLDREHKLASVVGAEVTPEAAVVRPGGAVAYLGRIDDRVPELGVRRSLATKRELRDALDSVLAGQPVAVPRTKAVGCLIGDWAQ